MKAEIREKMKSLRRMMSAREIKEKSAAIRTALFSLNDFNNARTVMIYASAFREVDTSGIIDTLLDSGKKVVIPVSDISSHTITPSYIDSRETLIKGAYGILEPREISEAKLRDIGFAVIPGIAFNEKCGRCGFGAGYYDRLLADFEGIKAGLCYDFQITNELETDAHDVGMDMVISERRIIYAV